MAGMDRHELATLGLQADTVGMLEGLTTTRAIRRYVDEPVPDHVLRDIMFAATRAPSGSNRQPFRFLVLTDGETAKQAKALIARGARAVWGAKRGDDGYDEGTGTDLSSPKARMAATMQQYVDNIERVPALVLGCLVRYRAPNPNEGASVYPAVQNVLLAARSRDKLEALAKEMNGKCIELDLESSESIQKAARDAGGVDILVRPPRRTLVITSSRCTRLNC